jgi:1-acyl-sn-glycerol-3-phosphate acyltransferase
MTVVRSNAPQNGATGAREDQVGQTTGMRWHRLWQLVASWVFIVPFGLFASLVTLLTFGVFSRRLVPFLLRFWGRTMLRIAGVRVEVEGLEHLKSGGMKIATFNHGSVLDAFLVPMLMPSGSVAAVKHQFLWYPVVGFTVYLMGFVMINRGNSARARATMERACERMKRNRLIVFISPEGTRSATNNPGTFKKGAFHLALESGAPIVPVLFDGPFELHPSGRYTTNPGLVRVRVLPPRDTTHFTAESLDREVEALHSLYVCELARLRADHVGDLAKAA